MNFTAIEPVIYLAGPITGFTWEMALAWREKCRERLRRVGFKTISPLDSQKERIPEDKTQLVVAPKREDAALPIEFTGSGIVTADEFYIRKADFLLCNFENSTVISPGTIWEMGLAWGLNKMIVSVIPPNNIHNNVFTRRRSHVFVPDLDEALEFLEKIPC